MRPIWMAMTLVGCAEAPPPPSAPGCDSTGFEVGECAPDFTLTAHTGEVIQLSELRGQRLVVAGSSMW